MKNIQTIIKSLPNIYKYQGAGNDFIIMDNRNGEIGLSKEEICLLCDRHYGIGSDGILLLENPSKGTSNDFKMVFYNPDGSTGMMCGNGGRCICFFAKELDIKSHDNTYIFEGPDTIHAGTLCNDNVKLSMTDVSKIKDMNNNISVKEILLGEQTPSNVLITEEERNKQELIMNKSSFFPYLPESYLEKLYFLNTGTNHLVVIAKEINDLDVKALGGKLRYDSQFAPEGANVNFVEIINDDHIFVRSYEKGVEDETYACGTGIVASAIASYISKINKESKEITKHYFINTVKEELEVEFTASQTKQGPVINKVYLTGPVKKLFEIK
ncbi:MAG: diaminopimelate epimerase [Bacteroidales bacterium]